MNLASLLARQDGQCLSHEWEIGYQHTTSIASFAETEGENLFDGILVSKKIRDAGYSCVFDTYGDENTTLAFIGCLLCFHEKEEKTLPSLEHLVEELRLSSNTKLLGLNADDLVYSKIRRGEVTGVELWATVFDLSFWENDRKALNLFEEAVNQILKEENDKAKPEFRKSKLETFKVLDLDEFEADLAS